MNLMPHSNPTMPFEKQTEVPLVELFLIFGVEPDTLREQKEKLAFVKPTILDSYPKKIPEEDHQYIGSLEMICFPEGYKVVEVNETNITIRFTMNHFIITGADGAHKYATALTFIETLDLHLDPLDDLDPKIHSIPKAFCLVSSLPLFELHKEVLKWLHDTYKQSTDPNYNNKDTIGILNMEFLLSLLFHHFHFSNQINSELRLFHTNPSQEEKLILKYRNHTDYGFVLQNFPFELLVKRISPTNILRIVCALLLERKVLFLFQNYQQNAVIMESIISLLSPFKWNFVNISYMSPELSGSLDAPIPYFIGIPPHTWKQVAEKGILEEDVLIFDVNNQTYIKDVDLPPVPEPAATVLLDNLKNLHQKKGTFVEASNEPKEKIAEHYWAYATLKVKQHFFNFMILLVNNFTEFYYKKRPTEGKDEISAESIFDFEKYLSMSHEHNKAFMQEFIKTQCFTNFIESAYTELDLKLEQPKKQKTDITCFQHGIKEILKYSYDSLLKKQWKKISSSLDRFSRPVNVSLTECRFQYEAALRDSMRGSFGTHEAKKILDHEKIVKMENFKINRQAGISPRQLITGPHHAKTNTMNMPKTEKRVGQKRMCTQIEHPVLPKKSPSPSMKVYQKKSPVNACSSQKGSCFSSQQNSPMGFLKKFSYIGLSKENAGMRKVHSPQFVSRKYEHADYTTGYNYGSYMKKPNVSPKADPRMSSESNNDRGGSIIMGATIAADKQLTQTRNQVENSIHPSYLSNRTTSDSARGTISKHRVNSSNVFEPCGAQAAGLPHNCYTPKQKDPKSHYQQTVKIAKGQGHKSMSGCEFSALHKTVQSKSRNNAVDSTDSTNTNNKPTLDPKSKRKLRYGSPSLSSGNLISFITPGAGSRLRMMLSQETSEILEEADAEGGKGDSPPEPAKKKERTKNETKKTQNKMDKPPRHTKEIIVNSRRRRSRVAYTPALASDGGKGSSSNILSRAQEAISTTGEKAAKFLTYQCDFMDEIEEEHVPLPKQTVGTLLTATKKGIERGLSTRVLSHQGDDDDDPCLP